MGFFRITSINQKHKPMKNLELKNGQEVTINIPFTYTIGEEGNYSGKELKTIEDCKAEVLAEIDANVLNSTDVMLSVENLTVNIKETKIDEIQHIIQCWGATTSCELELDASPCLSSTGTNKNNISMLVEKFNLADVTVVTYHNETEINETDIPYEDLSSQILMIMENYDLQKDEENQ